MAIKLLPVQPERLVPTGISSETTCTLSEKRVKWINYQTAGKEVQIKGMFEIAKIKIIIGAAEGQVTLLIQMH